MKLLVQHGAKLSQPQENHVGHISVVSRTARLMGILEVQVRLYPDLHEVYNRSIDGFGDVFRCLAFVASKGNDSYIIDVFGSEDSDRTYFFTYSFITIAGYSSQPGTSSKFIRLVLNTLSVNQTSQLEKTLFHRLGWPKDPYQKKLRSNTVKALEWVRSVKTQTLSLQHQARHAIICLMSCNRTFDASALGLPKHLERYVQLHDN